MDVAAYAQVVVDLVNRPLDAPDQVLELLRERGWRGRRVLPGDVEALRRVRDQLVDIVDRADAGDEAAVVEALNALLAAHPIRPQIAGHDARSWHLHVVDAGAASAEVLISEALFGLALVVTELGATRIGRCTASGCRRVYLDTSHNRSRRYCSARCATRVNVAEHRRRRADAGRLS